MSPDDLKELKQQAEELIVENATPSKIKKIREMMPVIAHLLESGVSIELTTDFINKNGVMVTKKYLKNMLHRIRKEQKPEAEKIDVSRQSKPKNNATPISPPPSTVNKNEITLADLTKKMDAFNKAVGWQDRYIALGGKIEDIRGKPASEQRHMAMYLKSTIERELRDHQ
ncbi:hypothetical protein C7R88_17705 (plasmid) [Plesiomonas shigelloides]|uniref:hypothetical protein n=1 Tax=Plesiomonas shigelloides TaxID=703 RepID=UPI000D134BBE|nr:hypothetical protein [Plesiomonas shigelloides]AVQ89155.1 hypothetical protein C7R88_17705 [Plesiomonas shigelloides]